MTRTPRQLLLLVLGLLVAAAAVSCSLGGATTDPRPVGPVAAASGGGDGREVFLRDCAWCHGSDGSGTQNGPSLEDAGALTTDFYLRTGRMPLSDPGARPERGPKAYDDRTIEALDAYVATLGEGPDDVTVEPGDAAAGRSLFLTNCAACHSASGTGMVMTGGSVALELWPTHPQQVGQAIRIGPGAMPPFTEEQLSDEEVDDVVSYVRTLGQPQVEGGAGIQQYGPIIEGLVVWLVGVPVVLLIARLLGKRARS